MACISIFGSNITLRRSHDFTLESLEVVQASITLWPNNYIFFCLFRPPSNRRNNPTGCIFIEQLPDLIYHKNNLPRHACYNGDMNIHFVSQLQSLSLLFQVFAFITLSEPLVSRLICAIISLWGR